MMMAWGDVLGRKRMQEFSPARSILGADSMLSYGSDWDNVPEPDPWLAMEALITRENPEHREWGKLGGRQAIDLTAAIEVMTYNGAYAMELEDVTGSIEVNKWADFIVLDQNLFEVSVDKIHETRVLRTVFMGKTVYQRQ